jgi:NTP pyrophosphatase (non-canonical NTP hydrolase)
MEFSEYQALADKTDQMPLNVGDVGGGDLKALMIPLLGLAGETGSLLTHYKRYLRDGEGYVFFRQRIAEELGDILWNVANIATKTNLSLDAVAKENVAKIRDRWTDQESDKGGSKLFDEGFPETERFPRTFRIVLESRPGREGTTHTFLTYKNNAFGNELSDNADEDDGYRLHDVFHLSFLAILGWSPVLRGKGFFNCKRKSDADVDEIEDGGRAAVIDEAIAALIFVEAKKNRFYETVDTVEYNVLRTIKDLTSHLEVKRCTALQWEIAILEGFRIWRLIRARGVGSIVGDLVAHTIEFETDGG